MTSETLSSSDSSQNYTDIFKYDLVGNRLTSAHTGPGNGADENITNTYNGDDELTKEVSTLSGETDLRYDPNGSLTTSTNGSDVTTYGYDVRNKMTSANVNGVTATYVYDDAGNRVGETTAGVTTFYLTDDDNPTGYAQPIEQKASAAAAPSVTYIIGDRVLGQANAAGAVSYLLTDGHGSTRALASTTGAVTETFNYTAFGGAIGFNASAAGTISNTTVFLFGGDAVFDPATGLYLHGDGTRARNGFLFLQMDSHAGLSSDPLSLHKYLYAGANPVMNVDFSGHDFTVSDLSASLGIVGAIAGFTIGSYYGHLKSGSWFSWQTAAYAAIGTVAGWAIGSTLGAGIGQLIGLPTSGLATGSGMAGVVARMTGKLLDKFAQYGVLTSILTQAGGVTPKVFATGFAAGFIAALLEPDDQREAMSATSLTAWGTNSAYNAILTKLLGAGTIPGVGQESEVLLAGFNAGYFTALEIRDIFGLHGISVHH